jgi:hypothetical protein
LCGGMSLKLSAYIEEIMGGKSTGLALSILIFFFQKRLTFERKETLKSREQDRVTPGFQLLLVQRMYMECSLCRAQQY